MFYKAARPGVGGPAGLPGAHERSGYRGAKNFS